jgi:hypothetical protein
MIAHSILFNPISILGMIILSLVYFQSRPQGNSSTLIRKQVMAENSKAWRYANILLL